MVSMYWMMLWAVSMKKEHATQSHESAGEAKLMTLISRQFCTWEISNENVHVATCIIIIDFSSASFECNYMYCMNFELALA